MSDSWSSSVSHPAFLLMGNIFFGKKNECQRHPTPTLTRAIQSRSAATPPPNHPLYPPSAGFGNLWFLELSRCLWETELVVVFQRRQNICGVGKWGSGADRGDNVLREKMCRHTSGFWSGGGGELWGRDLIPCYVSPGASLFLIVRKKTQQKTLEISTEDVSLKNKYVCESALCDFTRGPTGASLWLHPFQTHVAATKQLVFDR